MSEILDVYECADFILMRTAALPIEDRERVCRSEEIGEALRAPSQ